MQKFLTLLFILGLLGCEDKDPGLGNFDYIIFGHYYGFCSGEACVEIFKVTGSDVYEDTKDVYPGRDGVYNGEYQKLDRSFYTLAKGLENYVPSELLGNKEKIIGQPDAGDWGGLYFEFSTNGKRDYWYIDKNRSNLPDYLIPFAEQIESRIEALQPK